MEFADKLKTVSRESGLKLKEISDLTEIAYQTLKFYSQGRRKPKIEQIQKIAAIPELAPWKEFLLEQTELTAEESELMVLIGRMKAQGREAEVLAYLRNLQSESD